VMSDWGGTHSTTKAALAGLDQQMPDDSYFGEALKSAVIAGDVPMSRLNDMVVRILTSMITAGLLDRPNPGNLNVDVQTDEHVRLARELARAATVLIKNTANLLPLNDSVLNIAVIGDDGSDSPIIGGQGSGYVVPPYAISPLQGIKNRVNSNVKVGYANSKSVDAAVKLAQAADVAIVFVGTESSEGLDRTDLSLGTAQEQLITAVSKAQNKTIVVLHIPAAIVMPWINNVTAVLCAFYPGQEDGNAIADVLFGDHNPSGKLPVTFPVSQDQIPVNTVQQYPGINDEAAYSEKLLVGYRWYDAKNVAPVFPFGHGLSYTTFHYANPQAFGSISKGGVTVVVDITNTGSIMGSEVVQLYVSFPAIAQEPPQLLKGFQKVTLTPGQTETVAFKLHAKDVSIWEVRLHDWAVVSGTFKVSLGSSSRDIRASVTFNT